MKFVISAERYDDYYNSLQHYNRKGSHWYKHTYGKYQYQAKYARGRSPDYSKNDVVFVSGKVKFDKAIPNKVQEELDRAMRAGSKIIIGDAPGADTRCQDYLASKKYKNVEVYTTDAEARNNVGGWKVNKISGNGNTEERLVRRQKDIAMTNAATRGIAISSADDRPDSATALNIERLKQGNKGLTFFDYKSGEMEYRDSRSETKQDIADMKKIINQLNKDDFSDFSVPKNVYYTKVERDNGKPTAFVLAEKHRESDGVSVDLSVATLPEYRGKGLSTKLAKNAIEKAQADDEIRRIYWGAEKNNDKSIKMAQKLGFVYDKDQGEYKIFKIEKRGS